MTEPVDAAMMARIRGDLDRIAADEGVTLLLAIESGSRAWGFHSPDSDYDVRFIYAQPIDWHLSVEPGRDVIERPISDELDLSGWDLRKTLGLILRSNAVALEWLRSPITYAEAPGFREALLAFARQTLRRKPVGWHYLRLAERQYERMADPSGAIRLKTLFYVIRPILALRWMRHHGDAATPPMAMEPLIAEADLPAAARAEIAALTERKRAVKEMGTTDAAPPAVAALIAAELAKAKAWLGSERPDPYPDARDAADALMREWTHRADPKERLP